MSQNLTLFILLSRILGLIMYFSHHVWRPLRPQQHWYWHYFQPNSSTLLKSRESRRSCGSPTVEISGLQSPCLKTFVALTLALPLDKFAQNLLPSIKSLDLFHLNPQFNKRLSHNHTSLLTFHTSNKRLFGRIYIIIWLSIFVLFVQIPFTAKPAGLDPQIFAGRPQIGCGISKYKKYWKIFSRKHFFPWKRGG
jgi:hypothetical protein